MFRKDNLLKSNENCFSTKNQTPCHTSLRFPMSFSKSNDSSFSTRRSNSSGRLNVVKYSFTTKEIDFFNGEISFLLHE